MTAATDVAELPPTAVEMVAGFDVQATTERAAEHLLDGVAAEVCAIGGRQITTAVHRVQAFETAHVAMSMSASGTFEPGVLLELLTETARENASTGELWSAWVGGDGTGGDGTGSPALQACARQAALAHQQRSSGRVVHFPGDDSVSGTVTVRQLLTTAIDRVVPLGGGEMSVTASVVTRDFLRPRWQDGLLVLHVQPAVGGTWVPFESPNPTPCCALHD